MEALNEQEQDLEAAGWLLGWLEGRNEVRELGG
jgi:hypothetical protein